MPRIVFAIYSIGIWNRDASVSMELGMEWKLIFDITIVLILREDNRGTLEWLISNLPPDNFKREGWVLERADIMREQGTQDTGTTDIHFALQQDFSRFIFIYGIFY